MFSASIVGAWVSSIAGDSPINEGLLHLASDSGTGRGVSSRESAIGAELIIRTPPFTQYSE